MSRPGTVLFLSDYVAPYGGNFIPSLTALADALKARGSGSVLCFPAGAEERDWYRALLREGRTVETIDKSAGTLRLARRLDALCRQYDATLIHAHFGLFPAALLVGILNRKLKIVLHVHSDFSAGTRPPLKRRIGRFALGTLERAMGKRVKRIMVGEHMCAGVKNAVYIPNALVFGRDQGAKPRACVRAQLGLSDAQKLVLLFGWSPYIKGVDVAVRAVSRIAAEGFVLGIVTGREMDGARLKSWLDEQPGCGGAEGFIRFLPPSEDVYAYHNASDVMLSASRSETFSYALAEAIDAMRPCAASDIPGTRWAAAYETVTRFAPGDDAACAEAILRAADGCAEKTLLAMREKLHAERAIKRWTDGVLSVYAGISQDFSSREES